MQKKETKEELHFYKEGNESHRGKKRVDEGPPLWKASKGKVGGHTRKTNPTP